MKSTATLVAKHFITREGGEQMAQLWESVEPPQKETQCGICDIEWCFGVGAIKEAEKLAPGLGSPLDCLLTRIETRNSWKHR